MADRQHLAEAAEDHFLVGVQTRAAARSGSARLRPFARAVSFDVPDGASSFAGWCSSTISASMHDLRGDLGEAHHQHGADREVRRIEDG